MLIFVRVVARCLVLSNDFLNYIPFITHSSLAITDALKVRNNGLCVP